MLLDGYAGLYFVGNNQSHKQEIPDIRELDKVIRPQK